MAQILVRNIEDDLKARLKARAAQDGVSMEEAVRRILADALRPKPESEFGLGSRIAALFEDVDWGDEQLEPFPVSEVRPAHFD